MSRANNNTFVTADDNTTHTIRKEEMEEEDYTGRLVLFGNDGDHHSDRPAKPCDNRTE